MRKIASIRPVARFVGISLRDLTVTAGPLILLTIVAIAAAYWIMRPAPPDTITITSGPAGSTFQLTAEKYRKILARNGVKLRILPSEGSLENLKRLNDPKYRVDVGFVQGGLTAGVTVDKLVSLGSVFHEPLALFYRGEAPVTWLSELSGKRLAIGPEGSGTHALALILLKANGIEPGGATELLNLGGEDAAQALIGNKVDAAFLMGDSATPPIMRTLLWTPGIRLLNFAQADAYARRFPYLSKLDLPMGAFDFGKNIPPQDIHLIGPTVELVARDNLHPALSDMLIEAAREVHSGAKLLQNAGEFPAPLEHEYRISDDARRYYTSGKSFLYRNLPFWLASLVDRLLVVVVPIIVLLIPGLKLVPSIYSWRIRSRIYRWYGILITLERNMLAQPEPAERKELLKRLDDIEAEVNKMKMPLAYAEQFYVLRDHISFVRNRYANSKMEAEHDSA
ncbi:TAXI family TRAP transporter solute-binding subunit [Geobacter sp. AOG1]|uniref:TAXI family TRAP transporter solute-binding subunit n=1 Tax=Geobacter sp. AOG1 TaxID=1566346 RepID=UPI001CC5DEE3|nr:TAXI family TRAP transporter solute-binding subunit [Geobacter sp. AOG1]